METVKESEMVARMKLSIDEVGHDEFLELYLVWFPWHKITMDDIIWDVAKGES